MDTSQFYFLVRAHSITLIYHLLFDSIHGFKSIGYVRLVPSTPIYSSSYIESQSKLESTRNYHGSFAFFAVAMAVLVLAAAFLLPYLIGPFGSTRASSSYDF